MRLNVARTRTTVQSYNNFRKPRTPHLYNYAQLPKFNLIVTPTPTKRHQNTYRNPCKFKPLVCS